MFGIPLDFPSTSDLFFGRQRGFSIMAINLLFSGENNKKKHQHQIQNDSDKETYDDTNVICDIITKELNLLDEQPVRVRLIQDQPKRKYRVTILKQYKQSHSVKKKGSTTSVLPPGTYVEYQFLAEKVNNLEFVFIPQIIKL